MRRITVLLLVSTLLAVVPRGWILIGLVGLTPIFVSGQGAAASGPVLAIGLGGILLGFRAFDKLTAGIWSLAGAAIAWRQTAPVFLAATRRRRLTRAGPLAAVSRSRRRSSSASSKRATMARSSLRPSGSAGPMKTAPAICSG